MEEIDLAFKIIRPELHEVHPDHLPPYEVAVNLAEQKLAEVIRQCRPGQVAIGCDTIVVLDGHILGKPVDREDAFRILSTLSGKSHVVCSAVAMQVVGGPVVSGYETTAVLFNQVTETQVREYIESGEPMDKAGAYGIQGMGAFLVDSIEGNLDTVIGLPRSLTDRLAGTILSEPKAKLF